MHLAWHTERCSSSNENYYLTWRSDGVPLTTNMAFECRKITHVLYGEMNFQNTFFSPLVFLKPRHSETKFMNSSQPKIKLRGNSRIVADSLKDHSIIKLIE